MRRPSICRLGMDHAHVLRRVTGRALTDTCKRQRAPGRLRAVARNPVIADYTILRPCREAPYALTLLRSRMVGIPYRNDPLPNPDVGVVKGFVRVADGFL